MSLMQRRTDWLRLCRGVETSDLDRDRVIVAATFTAEPIAPYLGSRLVNDPARPPVVTIAPYNQLFQLCHNWQIYYADQTPTAMVLLWRIEDFVRPDFQAALRGAGTEPLLEKINELADAVAALRESFPGNIICSVPPFPHSPDHDIRSLSSVSTVGVLHQKVAETWTARIRAIDNIGLLDLDGLQRYFGVEASMDWRKWYLYRQPYSEAFWDAIGESAAALIRSQSTASKKCVVVDCDNTLWGGIIGEDGLAGIALGEDHPGSVFRDFQHQLLTLRSQGVMIALCSKNNEADVWEVFDKHDGMVLKRDDVVAARINWNDKPSNIASLAEELNIGLDSFVFVDDNAMEIEHVRAALPMVTSILVPSELPHFPREFGSYRGFDRDKISNEDRARSDMMLQERKRRDLATVVSAEDFRRELQLSIDLFEVQPEHIARVTQLINKSNQFNLTTRRKTENDIKNLIEDSSASVLAWRVTDRFGEYGLVGVTILQHEGDATDIDTLLMSCRVLGRGVERSVFAGMCDLIRKRGSKRLVGTYLRTNKNQLVENLYTDYGFRPTSPEQFVLDDLDSLTWPEEIARPGL